MTIPDKAIVNELIEVFWFFEYKTSLVNKIDTASLEPWSMMLKMGPLLELFGAIVELVDNGVLGLL